MYNTWCVKALRGHVFVSLQSIERYPTPRALRTAAQTSPWSCWTPSRRTRPLPRSSGSTACTTSPSTPSCRAATQELLRYVILSWLHRCCAGGKTISVWCLHGRGDHEQVSRASDIFFFLCQIKLEGVYRVGWSMHQSVSGKNGVYLFAVFGGAGSGKETAWKESFSGLPVGYAPTCLTLSTDWFRQCSSSLQSTPRVCEIYNGSPCALS